jgi:biopolymer transport protein ExbB
MLKYPAPAAKYRLASFIVLVSFASAAFAQDAPPAEAIATGSTEQSLLDLFLQGGALMYVIGLCSLGTIAVAAFCAMKINKRKLMPAALVGQLTEYMGQKDLQNTYRLCQENPTMLTNALGAAVLKADFNEPKNGRAMMEKAAAEKLVHEETRLTLWINYLNVFATIAPMLGLLGTVAGMITAFNELAAGRSEPSDLAGGIGQAMITTAGGLIVGIPAMFLFFFFRNNLSGAIADIEAAILGMLDWFVAPADQPVSDEPPQSPPADEAPVEA